MKHFLIFVLAVAPVFAHHSFAAEFDSSKPVELKGTLVELEWVNPHAWIHMEVTDAAGKVTKWDCELGSPNLLMRNGWRKDVIKKGDVMSIKEAITSSSERAIQSFDAALHALYKSGKVMLEEALANADSRANLEAKINFG